MEVKHIKCRIASARHEDYITPQCEYIKELTELKYDSELMRERGLIEQSSQMQAAFSFVTAALVMALPPCLEYRGIIPLKFFFISVSFILLFLICSLIFASLAQWRWKKSAFADIPELKNAVLNDPKWKQYAKSSYRCSQWTDMVAKVQSELAKLNDKRSKLIMASMISFYVSIVAILILYIVAVCILLQ